MICPKCNSQNTPGIKLCVKCGQPLVLSTQPISSLNNSTLPTVSINPGKYLIQELMGMLFFAVYFLLLVWLFAKTVEIVGIFRWIDNLYMENTLLVPLVNRISFWLLFLASRLIFIVVWFFGSLNILNLAAERGLLKFLDKTIGYALSVDKKQVSVYKKKKLKPVEYVLLILIGVICAEFFIRFFTSTSPPYLYSYVNCTGEFPFGLCQKIR